MAEANNLPIYAQNQKTADAAPTAAVGNPTSDAPTGTVVLLTAGEKGAIVTRLSVIPRATLAANVGAMLFVSRDTGTTKRLKDAETIPAQTVNVVTGGPAETNFVNYSEDTPLRLAPNEQLWVGVGTISNVVFNAEYTNY